MKEQKLRKIVREQIKKVISEQGDGEPKMKRARKIEHVFYYPDGNTGVGSAPKSYRRLELMDGEYDWRIITGYADDSPKPIDQDLAEELERVYQNQIA